MGIFAFEQYTQFVFGTGVTDKMADVIFVECRELGIKTLYGIKRFFLTDVEIDQFLRVERERTQDFGSLFPTADDKCKCLQGRDKTITGLGIVVHDDMPALLTAEVDPFTVHDLKYILVAYVGAVEFETILFHEVFEPLVAHDRRDDTVTL